MSKKCYRYYGGLLSAQEKWLNSMAVKGYRLVRAERLLYEFEECSPGQYQYCIEFVGHKSRESTDDYRIFLEDLGYKVFTKNINLNYSIGKVRYRPWAEKGGRIATHSTTYDRELLIVEKENDGKMFEMHTSCDDKILYCKNVRKPWLFLCLLCLIFGIGFHSLIFDIFSVITLIPCIVYQAEIIKLNQKTKISEE